MRYETGVITLIKFPFLFVTELGDLQVFLGVAEKSIGIFSNKKVVP